MKVIGDIKLSKEESKMIKNGLTEKLEKLQKENTELKETIKSLREEGEAYDKIFDNIDLQAMCIQDCVKKIRQNI